MLKDSSDKDEQGDVSVIITMWTISHAVKKKGDIKLHMNWYDGFNADKISISSIFDSA